MHGIYSHAPHNDVSVNDGPHIWRWSHKILILNYHCVTVVHSIQYINPLHAELNPIRHLLALVGARHIVHVSRVRVNMLYRYVA